MRSTAVRLVLGIACLAAALPAAAATVPPAIAGADLGGSAAVKIDPRDGSRLTVVVFLSARCPCSASHEPVLAELAREYGAEARFIGVHSNADETEAESREHFKGAGLPFPVIQDPGARLADSFGALKTPHAYVLAKNGDVLYEGGVDDSHIASQSSKHYLKDTLAALKAGQAPPQARERSLGCLIQR